MNRNTTIQAVLAVAAVIGIVALVAWDSGAWRQQATAQAQSAEPGQAAKSLDGLAVATFAGGCFWCVEATFEKLPGVSEVVSGYSGGHTENPTYKQVSGGGTGHTEAARIFYDPAQVSYEALLHQLWREIDPTDSQGQFVDRGSEYRPAIFYHNETERRLATASRDALAESDRYQGAELTIEIIPFEKFYDAETYHQDYYKKNPVRYQIYRRGSGRDQFLERIWGDELHAPWPGDSTTGAAVNDAPGAEDPETAQGRYRRPPDQVIRDRLTDIQHQVTQHDATEPPFNNAYWDNNRDGIYVDIVSGEPLFSSTTKYKSGTGWPSFWEPIDDSYIVEKADFKLLFPRTEVRSRIGDSHLGHVFNDGPAPTGLRYCINSAALRFIERESMAGEGYGDYLALFR